MGREGGAILKMGTWVWEGTGIMEKKVDAFRELMDVPLPSRRRSSLFHRLFSIVPLPSEAIVCRPSVPC